MNFLFPAFLFALSAISIPIIIHLFRFRRYKKVYFSNISFLEYLQDETQKQSRLKHLLILISRILVLVFLVFAFAKPFLPAEDSDLATQRHISVFVDNSLSMQAGSGPTNALDDAIDKAREIAFSFDVTDRFQLLTHDFEGRHQRFVSRDEFIGSLDELDFSPFSRSVSEVMQRQKDFLSAESNQSNVNAFILSDFQKSTAQLKDVQADSLVHYYWVPIQNHQQDNVFVDSVWIESPIRLRGATVEVKVQIGNSSEEGLVNQPLRLFVNGVQRSVATFDVGPHSNTQVTLNYTVGNDMVQQGYVEVSDAPIVFDDRLYFSFRLSENIPVLSIYEGSENAFVNALFRSDTLFNYATVNASQIDYSLFPSYHLIILTNTNTISPGLSSELHRYVESGGSLLLFPGTDANTEDYNRLLSALGMGGVSALEQQDNRVTDLNAEHPLFRDVFERIPENLDLPRVSKYYKLEQLSRSATEVLLQMQNGDHFFTYTPVANGRVYLSAVPASTTFSNFARHPIFVPALFNAALMGANRQALYYTLGDVNPINLYATDIAQGEVMRILGNQMEIIPEQRRVQNRLQIFVHDQLRNAGFYELFSGQQSVDVIAYNYNRKQSLTTQYSTSDIKTIIADQSLNVQLLESGSVGIQEQLDRLRQGYPLWRWFVFLALVFLLMEALLIRFLPFYKRKKNTKNL